MPPAAAQLATELRSPYFGGAGQMADPVLAPPLTLTKPAITGVAQVGQTLTRAGGTWRSAAGTGQLTTGAEWYRCTDVSSTTSVETRWAPASPVRPSKSRGRSRNSSLRGRSASTGRSYNGEWTAKVRIGSGPEKKVWATDGPLRRRATWSRRSSVEKDHSAVEKDRSFALEDILW